MSMEASSAPACGRCVCVGRAPTDPHASRTHTRHLSSPPGPPPAALPLPACLQHCSVCTSNTLALDGDCSTTCPSADLAGAASLRHTTLEEFVYLSFVARGIDSQGLPGVPALLNSDLERWLAAEGVPQAQLGFTMSALGASNDSSSSIATLVRQLHAAGGANALSSEAIRACAARCMMQQAPQVLRVPTHRAPRLHASMRPCLPSRARVHARRTGLTA